MSVELSVVKVGLPAVSTFVCPENRITLLTKKMVDWKAHFVCFLRWVFICDKTCVVKLHSSHLFFGHSKVIPMTSLTSNWKYFLYSSYSNIITSKSSPWRPADCWRMPPPLSSSCACTYCSWPHSPAGAPRGSALSAGVSQIPDWGIHTSGTPGSRWPPSPGTWPPGTWRRGGRTSCARTGSWCCPPPAARIVMLHTGLTKSH